MKLKDWYRAQRLEKVSQFLRVNTPRPTVWKEKQYSNPWDYLKAVSELDFFLDRLNSSVERICADHITAVYSSSTTDPLIHIKDILCAVLDAGEESAVEVYGQDSIKPIVWEMRIFKPNLQWETEQSQLTVVYTTRSIKLFYYYQASF